MAYDDLQSIRGEILDRPKFQLLHENLLTNKIGKLITRAVNQAQIKHYEQKRLSNPNFEVITPVAGLTLPAGTNFGANSKEYILDSTTSPVLPTGLLKIKKLWVVGDSAAKKDSMSTYDTEETEGTGIPADNTAIGVSDFYHEHIGEGAAQQLIMVIGTTAAGSAPKVGMIYVSSLVLVSADVDSVNVPYGEFITTFMPMVDSYLQQYVGSTGF